MGIFKRFIPAACLSMLVLMISCKDKKTEEPLAPSSLSYVVSDSLRLWCKTKMPPSRILSEGDTLKLLFFEEELNLLWKPAYSEEAVKDLSKNGVFSWEQLPAHEGNRRWALSLTLQEADSTYLTPNNLLLYLFRQ